MSEFDWTGFEAALFDLDGVITPTATVHTAAWKRTFDAFLVRWSRSHGVDQHPFDPAHDYRTFVDGRPRYDGVAQFLASRSIELRWGDASDPPGYETVCALGNLKNDLVNDILEADGVEPYPGSVRLIEALERMGMAMAVVSASANAGAVLAAAGLAHRFAQRVDGLVAAELGLAGKPAPDPFLEASRRLGFPPHSCVVIEDAVAGVQAGVAGGFGAVIGVDRHHDPEALVAAGATIVVADLAELCP